MKEKILKLREEGKTYSEIKLIVGCSKSTVAYYCGDGQKEKSFLRGKKLRNSNKVIRKIDTFKKNSLKCKSFRFQKNDEFKKYNKLAEQTFNYKDVIEKFGKNTKCYLTGDEINLITDSDYEFDHIIPKSKGGDSTLENLGILKSIVNRMKHSLSPEEFIEVCIKVLKYNGYKVEK